MNTTDLLAHAETYARRLAGRDYRRTGIEMFLALENLQTETPLAPVSNSDKVADVVESVAGELLKIRTDDPVRALRVALEVVATAEFGQMPEGAGEHLDPAVTGAGRKPLRLPATSSGAAGLVRDIRAGRYLRSVNYHNTLLEDRTELETQLARLAERFASIGVAELEDLIAGKTWTHDKAPVLLVFYEGLRNHFDVTLPLLEAFNLRGIFCLIPGFIDAPAKEQVAFARKNYIDVRPEEYADGRVALSWDEARDLAKRGHTFVCHTMTHADPDASDFNARYESVEAVARMTTRLGRDVRAFVWRRGLEWGGDVGADELLKEAGMRLLVSNFRVQHLP